MTNALIGIILSAQLWAKKIKHHCDHPSDKWVCTKCIKNNCDKCNLSTHQKPNTTCCVCQNNFHDTCIGFSQTKKEEKNYKSTKKSWICKTCKPIIFPFQTITNADLTDLSSHKNEKYSRQNMNTTSQSPTCKICKKNLNRTNHGVPCSSFKSKIHPFY